MSVFPLVRIAVLGVTTLFSFIVLAVAAHLISETQQFYGLTTSFSALAVAVAVITLITLPVMLVADITRRSAFTSMIMVELAWLYVLCILWVATAGQTVTQYALLGNCVFVERFIDNNITGLCQSTQAIEAFSFLNFIITFLYAGVLSALAVVAATRGEGIWLLSVREAFGSPAVPREHPMTKYNTETQRTGAGTAV